MEMMTFPIYIMYEFEETRVYSFFLFQVSFYSGTVYKVVSQHIFQVPIQKVLIITA